MLTSKTAERATDLFGHQIILWGYQTWIKRANTIDHPHSQQTNRANLAT